MVQTSAQAAAPRAFPGAEGFGTDSPGGRGGVVCQVTNLSDSGAGSLRACVNASGPRYVIFRVGGTIELNTRLDVANPFITIAGQTAPGDGITLRMKPGTGVDDGAMKIDTHDVVIRFIRFRPGDGGGADDSHDAISAYKSGGGSYNVVLDHNSFSWAVDELVNIYYDVDQYTISNSIISEALSNAGHPGGEHSKGMLIGGGSTNGSVHHNLFVSNKDRNPQVSGVVNADLRNNVIYNYGDGSGDGVTLISSSKGEPVVNWVGNYYKPGPDSPTSRAEFATYNGDTGSTHQWYGSGNQRWTSSGDQAARVASGAVGESSSEFPMAPVTTDTAADAYTKVLASAGASRVRDAVDVRLVDDVTNGTGSIIDSPSEVGGWPTLAAGTPPTDSDGDGVPDAFETGHGSDPNVADATADADGNGYMNVEDWANSLAGDAATDPEPEPSPSPSPTADPVVIQSPAMTRASTSCGVASIEYGIDDEDTDPSDFEFFVDGLLADYDQLVPPTYTIATWTANLPEDSSGGSADVVGVANGETLLTFAVDTNCVTDPEPTPTPTPNPAVQLVCPVVADPVVGDEVICTYE